MYEILECCRARNQIHSKIDTFLVVHGIKIRILCEGIGYMELANIAGTTGANDSPKNEKNRLLELPKNRRK